MSIDHKKYNFKKSITNSGIYSYFENIIRSHPLIYYFARKLVRFTNIFEEDSEGLKLLKFDKKINIFDIGASDGIASKFFLKNLKVNKIICYEPDKNYVKILKNINKKIIVKPYAVGEKEQKINVYFPEYNILKKKFRLITYCYYNKDILRKQIQLDFKFRKKIKIVKKSLKINKIKPSNFKIDLIKIDVNGFEYSVIKGCINIIKKYKPAIILETGKDIEKIHTLLKKNNYFKFRFNKSEKKFKKDNYNKALNTYFLQKKHFN